MTAWQIALAALAGIAVYIVAVAAPVGVLLGRAVRIADERERQPERPAQERHPSGRHLRSVAL